MILSFIAVIDEKLGLGKDGKLLVHLPGDLKLFKKYTLGHPIIMGRKTFESIGNKALKDRLNIVVSRNQVPGEGFELAHSIEEAFEKSKAAKNDEVFLIGGAELFKQTMDRVDRLYLTHIHHSFDADTFFPAYDESEWRVSFEEKFFKDEKNPYDYTFRIYERKNQA